jgi:hypothetical protein
MVWSHYKNEAIQGGSHHNNNDQDYDENPLPNQPMEYEEWKTWHSTDLFNMWQGIVGYLKDTYIERDIFNEGDFDDFCTGIYNFSSKFPSKNAT